MMYIYFKRFRQVIQYGIKDAKEIIKFDNCKKSFLEVYFEILYYFCKYYLYSNQYKNNKFWLLDESEKKEKSIEIGRNNINKDLWVMDSLSNWKFLSKYTKIKWQNTIDKREKRARKYQKHYHFQYPVFVEYGVKIIATHFRTGSYSFGKDVLLARDTDIDITGDLIVGNGVSFAEGCKVLTHMHDFFGTYDDSELIPYSNRAHVTPLEICDNVLIGAHSIIMPGVRRIGQNSIVSAGSVVTKPVPDNCIVAGNPAQVISKFSPKVRIYTRSNH